VSDTLTFDIPEARADLALIAFAEQADRTLLFSFDETHDKTANRVSGQYEVIDALELLLAGTGLSISMGTQGQLSVVESGHSNGDTVVKKTKINTSQNRYGADWRCCGFKRDRARIEWDGYSERIGSDTQA
jgi:hypothetical protein